MSQITFPQQTTYFICYVDNQIFNAGVVEPNQEMISGLPYIYETTSKVDWLNELVNYNTYLGYVFNDIEDANDAKTSVDNYYGPNTCTIEYTTNNDPNFWYILGTFTPVLGDPILFQKY